MYIPWIKAGKVGRLQDAGPLVAAVQVARAEGAGHGISVPEDGSAAAPVIGGDS